LAAISSAIRPIKSILFSIMSIVFRFAKIVIIYDIKK